jgi:hypothetical protein
VQAGDARQDGCGQLGGEHAEGGVAGGGRGDALSAQSCAQVSVAGRAGRAVAGQDPYARLKKALRADIDPDAWESLRRTESRPFPRPDTGKIAVKVINDYGDEVMKVFTV